MALLMVLVALLVASVLAMAVVDGTRTGIALTRGSVESARAEALAEAGLHFAAHALIGREPERAAPRRLALELEDGTVDIIIEDEDGKIDLNHADARLLTGLFLAAGIDDDEAAISADRIIDFRDADDEPRPLGAEAADYPAIGGEAPPKNAPFDSIVELRRVPGIDQPLMERLERAITISTGNTGIDPNVAGFLALSALPGMTEETANRLLDEAAAAESNPSGHPLADMSGLEAARSYLLGSRESQYTIRSISHLTSGATFELVTLIELDHGAERPFAIHDRRRGMSGAVVDGPDGMEQTE